MSDCFVSVMLYMSRSVKCESAKQTKPNDARNYFVFRARMTQRKKKIDWRRLKCLLPTSVSTAQYVSLTIRMFKDLAVFSHALLQLMCDPELYSREGLIW